MKCTKCNKENRDGAVYCRHCGEKLPAVAVDPFAGLIGLEQVKKSIAELIETYTKVHERLGSGAQVEADMILMGASGTGKTALAHAISKALYTAGMVKQPKPMVVDAVEWNAFVDDWGENVKKVKDGVLVIENAQKLVPDSESRDVDQLDILFSAMECWKGNPVVILTGLPGGFREYIDANPSVKRRFEYQFNLDEYKPDELTAIALQTLTQKHQARLAPDTYGKLERVFQYMVRHKEPGWSNAHEALRLADTIFYNMLRRGDDVVEPADIPGKEHRDKTSEEILAELDKFVGIDNIRAEVVALINQVEEDRRNGEKPSIKSHYVFTGNPGTGKTTIARVFADTLKALGVLPVGQLIEADRDKMVVGYVGHTARATNELVDSAIGGVLFIDEAYTLTQGGQGDFGKEALDTLLKRLSDDKGKFVCIVAGYTKEMFDFIQSNPGLKRRFNQTITFNDYDGAALTEIFRRLVRKEGFALDENASNHLRAFFDRMYATRTKDFGNAGECDNLMIEAKKRYSSRISQARRDGTFIPEMEKLFTRDDIEGDASEREPDLDEVIAEMNKNFIGMQSVKDAVRTLGNNVAMMQKRIQRGAGNIKLPEIHIRLTGNPGTGKTEIARTLGKMLKAIKVLPTDKVIEVDKSGLIGTTVGSTPEKVNNVVDRAMGGILFIDEAYALAQEQGVGYGKEAVETLMKRLEDDRGKFVCILAGYPREMDQFLGLNPGLSSRIRYKLHIEDYTADELMQIFMLMARKEDFKLTPDAEDKLREVIDTIVDLKDENFGNARTIRNLLNDTKDRMNERLMMMPDPTDDDLFTITAEDIPTYQEFNR